MTNKQLRALALQKLRGNWGNAIVICVAYTAMILLVAFCHILNFLMNRIMGLNTKGFLQSDISTLQLVTSSTLNLAFFIFFVMASFTVIRQFIDMSQGNAYNLSRNLIMQEKKHFFKVSVVPHFVKIGIITLSALPGVLGLDSAKRLYETFVDKDVLSLFNLMFFMMSVLFVVISVVLTFNSVISLHFLKPLILLNPMMPVSQAISLCFKKAEGNKARVIGFYLSFVKFLPLVILVYPTLVLIPYYIMCNLVFCEDVLGAELSKDTFSEVFGKSLERNV